MKMGKNWRLKEETGRGRLDSRSFRSPFEDLIKPKGVMQISEKCYEKAHLFNWDYITSESNRNPFKVDVLSLNTCRSSLLSDSNWLIHLKPKVLTA